MSIAVTSNFLDFALSDQSCYSHVQFRVALENAGWETKNPNRAEAVRLIIKRALEKERLVLCSDPRHAGMGRVRVQSPDPLGDHSVYR